MKDQDVNCRLRYGLNVHCLAEIFQYLDSVDLNTLAEMNEFYHHTINDLIIPKHTVNLNRLYDRGISMAKVFKRFGTKIRKFRFEEHLCDTEHSIKRLCELIRKHCAIDQLKCVEITCNFDQTAESIQMPIQFRNVEKFKFKGGFKSLMGQLFESVRYLHLSYTNLGANFDWTKLKNLKHLYLNKVHGINVPNFIELFRLGPKIEIFKHYNLHNFPDGSIHDVCAAMAKYCGNDIREYHGMIYPKEPMLPLNLYGFLSGFRNVKNAILLTNQICCGDIIDGLKGLAANDTIEMLRIHYCGSERNRFNVNCNFQERPNLQGLDMKQFSRLRKLRISGRFNAKYTNRSHGSVCNPFKIFQVYGAQILSNVELLTIDSDNDSDLDFIKFASKLRCLTISDKLSTFDQKIAPIIEDIFRKRRNVQNTDDFIKVKFSAQPNYAMVLIGKVTTNENK